MPFAPEYVSCVLNENFEDAKALFLSPLLAIHHAHLAMLVERGILGHSDGRALADALASITPADVQQARYDGSCEDLFFFVEGLIVQRAGGDVAGRLHTARSRNDIDMTMYRMQQRELILAVAEGTLRLRRSLLELADRHRHDVFAAHTHTQPAQPTTIAHYLMGLVEQLERDAVRLRAAFASTNLSPLGSCAITGTGFPIDRSRTAALLGFAGATGNTYGSIATVDYLLESVSAVAVLLAGLGRVLQDLLMWCTSEFGYLRLADGFVQGSSIMPQKRNPVALEHARAIASKALGQSSAIVLTVHNTPFGDIVDTEDDLQPLVFAMFSDAVRAVRLVAAALGSATFDVERMGERARRGWITVTELADSLTRDHQIPFNASHAIASRLVRDRAGDSTGSLAGALDRIAIALCGKPVGYTDGQLEEILSPAHFVRVRNTPGGPAPEQTAMAIAASRSRLASDQEWLDGTLQGLRDAEKRLKDAVAAL